MSSYSVFFDYHNKTYRLPVNPEEIESTGTQAIEKYEVLKLGQIAIPTHMELTEYSFECEFPTEKVQVLSSTVFGAATALGLEAQFDSSIPNYVETSGKFEDADYYINLFTKWRNELVPVRFIASNGLSEEINTLVLIEELTITEKAGEEGDKYISFKLLEYREYGKNRTVQEIDTKTAKKKKSRPVNTTNPKSSGNYVVKQGDSLYDIAKKYYGDGSKYTKIVDANKDKIKNASLLKNGWKLVIPS